nr:putative ribonuclease H-like domain-containing protein [Tanacetum cinerariifolium]
KHTVVANSITEAEYVVASSCCGQVLWIQNQLLNYWHTLTTAGSKLMLLGITYYRRLKVNAARHNLLVLGSAMPTNPHHTFTLLQSSSFQPQKTQKPRKPTRKVTEVPQPSDPIKHVADEAVHKKLGDSLVRVSTTASSLEAE